MEQRPAREEEEEIIYLSLASLDEEGCASEHGDAAVKAVTYLTDPKHIFRKFAIDYCESG